MTWFQYHNYGSALQVTALYENIKKMGHDPFVVDYLTNGKPVCLHKVGILKDGFTRGILRFKNHFYQRYEEPSREQKFENFYKKNIKFTKSCKNMPELEDLNKEYDSFVCGSDQIWAPSSFDSHYFLDFVRDEKKIFSYAPSVGLPEIEDKNIKNRMAELVKRFSHISVREKQGATLIANLIKRSVETVLDPTLLLNKEEWLKKSSNFAEKLKPYLLVYMLGKNENHWKSIYEIAKVKNLEVKIIPSFFKDLNRKGCIKEPIGPDDFLSLINNAEFICTDSFHGLVFSLNFNKQFCIFERFKKNDKKSQNSRIYNILNLFKIEGHLISDIIPESIYKEINYKETNTALKIEKDKSLKYLKNTLNSIEKYILSNDNNKNIALESSLCCGCGACTVECPVNAIEVIRDKKGFYTAKIDENKCIFCEKCIEVCPYVARNKFNELKNAKLYSYKDNEKEVLLKSSSGGMGFKIAKDEILKGNSVIGCILDEKKHYAKHIIVNPHESEKLTLFQGSKYMQSDFSKIISELKNLKNGAVVFGTPCQIAGVRNAIGNREDILLVDLICHGVPSYNLYQKYLEYLKKYKKMDIQKNINTIFRYKEKGWRERYIYNSDFNVSFYESQKRDPYFLAFEYGFCYSKGCYDCLWRDKSAADIRLGDYWHKKYEKDKTGVSMVLSFTEKGEKYIEELIKNNESIIYEDIKDYYICQQIKNNQKPVFWEEFIEDLSSDKDLKDIVSLYIDPFAKRREINHILIKIKGVLHNNDKK